MADEGTGCVLGGKNEVKIDQLQKDSSQHDKRINSLEVDMSEIRTEIKNIPDQVGTRVTKALKENGNGNGNGHGPPMLDLRKFGFPFPIPYSWIGAIVITLLVWLGAAYRKGGTEEVTKVIEHASNTAKQVQMLMQHVQRAMPTNPPPLTVESP